MSEPGEHERHTAPGGIVVAGQELGYDAFISYSHQLDATIAARLQSELQRFAKPWYRMRALHVFRDQTSLAASPHLWITIEQALADSRWLILMASPESAASPWVAREIAWWRAHRPINHLLVAVTAGDLAWDEGAGDLDWAATTALSKEALGHAFQQEPRWVDLRWARDQDSSLRSADPRLQDAVADLAAAIRQVPKDSLIGEHIQQRRRTVRAALAVAVSLVLLAALAVTGAVIAKGQRDRATSAETAATAGLLASTAITLTSSHPDLAQLFAVQAFKLDPGDPQARAALFAAVQADPQVQRFIQARGPVSAVASSADGRTLVAGTTNGWVQTWNLATFQPTSLEQLGYPVSSVAASGDGTTIVATGGPQAQAWVRGQAVRPASGQPGAQFTAAGVSPSGRFAAFASFPYLDVLDTKSRTWTRVRVRGFRTVPRGRPPTVTDIAIPSDSQLVAFDGRYGSWQRLALPGLASVSTRSNAFGTGRFPAYAYALSPTGLLATHSSVAAGSSLRVWATSPGHNPVRTAHPGGRLALALALSRDGRWLASEDASGIHVSRISGRGQSGGQARAYPGAEPIFDTSLSFLGTSDSRLVSASGDLLTLWNLNQYSRIGAATRIRMPWRCGQVCPGPRLAISPDGRQAVMTSSNGDLLMTAGLGGAFGQITRLARGSTQAYGYPEWVPGGHRLYVYGTKLRAITPRAGGGAVISPDPYPPQYVTTSRDGKSLVEIDAAGDIRFRSLGTGRVSAPVSGPPGLAANSGLYQRQAGVSAAGTREAVIDQSSRSVYVVNTRTGTSWAVPGIKAYELAYAGEHLVVERVNGTLDLRGPDGKQVIRSVQAGTPWNYGNIAVTGGPSGPLVAEERANGQGVIADMGSGHLLGVFPIGKTSPYQQTTMAFSPGGGSLVTVTEGNDRSPDGMLTQLSMSPRQWVAVACATSGHQLTQRDWRQYISAAQPARLGCTG